MTIRHAIDELLALPSPFDAPTPEGEALFARAMAEADAQHRTRNPAYAALWNDDAQRPLVPIGLFKQADLGTPVDGEGVWLGSSGTSSGQATRVFFDRVSMERIRVGMTRIFLHHGLVDTRPSHFLLLSPDPASGQLPGYATTFDKFTACAPVQEKVFAVGPDGLDVRLALDTLARWSRSGHPVFIFGLTVHFEQLCLAAQAPIVLEQPVRGLTGGGWKGWTKTLDRTQIVERLTQAFPSGLDLRDLFGMTEHPLHYVSCKEGRFHLPQYARASVVDAQGGTAADGELGLIRLQSPLFASLPSHDLLTEDLGRHGRGCRCGSPLPFIEYVDRMTPPQGTCAATAASR